MQAKKKFLVNVGILIVFSRHRVSLCERKSLVYSLGETGMIGTKPVSIQNDVNADMWSESNMLFFDILQYQRLICNLIYLTDT